MRWRTKTEPKEGDQRWIRRFAWLPVATKYDESVWLESYDVLQRYSEGRVLEGGGYVPRGWADVEFRLLTRI